MTDLFTTLLLDDPTKLPNTRIVKEDDINKCIDSLQNSSLNVNEIILQNVSNTSLFNLPVKANKSLIRNSLFIIYLFQEKKDDYHKLRNTIFKQKPLLPSLPSDKLSNKLLNKPSNKPIKDTNFLDKLLKMPIPTTGGANNNKDNYKELIKKLKKENRDEFIIWFCQYMSLMYKIKNQINKKPNMIDQIKKLKIKDVDITNLTKALPKYINKFGDIYNYILIIATILYQLRIMDIDLYNKIKDKTIFNKSLKDQILSQLTFYRISDIISFPIKDIYTNYNKIINANCYSNLLNYTYYFRYALSLYNIPGGNKNIYEILGKGNKNQIYSLKDLADLTSNIGKPWLDQLAKFVGYKGKKLDTFRENRGNMYFWISNNYLILSAEVKKNNIKISSIGTELTQDNKIKKSKYDTDVLDIIFQGGPLITNKDKTIEIKCLTNNKIILGSIKYKIETENNEKNIVIYIDNDRLYNITKTEGKDGDKYCLYRLCGGITGPVCIIEFMDTKKGLTFKTKYTMLPLELILGFITGLIIENNDKMGKIMDRANSKIISQGRKRCDSQIYTEEFIESV